MDRVRRKGKGINFMLPFVKDTEWFKKIKDYNYIMIFGANSDAFITCKYIQEIGSDIECFIVSKRKDNPLELDGKPVKIFDDIEGNIRRKGLVVISQNYASNDEMMKILY